MNIIKYKYFITPPVEMSPPSLSTLIPSTATTTTTILTTILPPKSPPSPPLSHIIPTTRRAALTSGIILTSIFPFLSHQPPPATAFSLGISGPKDWLRDQKKKAAKYLLAPIDASRNTLQAAYTLIITGSGISPEKDLEEVQRMLISASRDCIPKERNSIVTFQSNTGVEVCTFKLVLKNAASLLDDKDPTKVEAEAKLGDLERSFSSLNTVANGTTAQLVSDRQKVADALMDTISSLNNFEQEPILEIVWLGGPVACTKYNRQHGVPSSGWFWMDLGKLRSLLNRLCGSCNRP